MVSIDVYARRKSASVLHVTGRMPDVRTEHRSMICRCPGPGRGTSMHPPGTVHFSGNTSDIVSFLSLFRAKVLFSRGYIYFNQLRLKFHKINQYFTKMLSCAGLLGTDATHRRSGPYIQYNLNDSNTDGSFTVDDSNSFFSRYKILPIAQENK